MRKTFLTIITLLTVVLLVACGAPNNGEKIDFADLFPEKETIRVWIDDQEGEYMKAVIKAFNETEAGKGIVVEHQHMGTVDARERLKTFGLTGNGADIFQFPHDHLAAAILDDLVYALPETVRTKVAERAHPLGLDIATILYDEGTGEFGPGSNATPKLYAVPMSLEAVGLYYNKDLVEGDPVETYEELIAQAKVWNAAPVSETDTRTNAEAKRYFLATSSHWADSYFMQHIYSAFGFKPFGPNLDDASKVGFADAKEALEWMVDELKPITTGNNLHDGVAGGDNFANGLVPYIIGGPWNIEQYRDEGLNFGIAPLPSINGEKSTPFAGAQMAAIYKYSQNKDAATKFLEFLMSDKAMELQLEYKYKLPALKNDLLANIEGFSDDPFMQAISLQLQDAIPMPTIPEVQYYWGPGESMIKSIWNEGTLPATAVVTAEDAYEAQKALGGK